MTQDNKGKKEATVKTQLSGKSQLKRTQMLAVLAMQSLGDQKMLYLLERNNLLTNGYNAPIPRKMLNQRQKRKIARQTS